MASPTAKGKGKCKWTGPGRRERTKGVAACQGNREIVRTKATIRTKAKKNQAQAIA